jgi:hypothetical protein
MTAAQASSAWRSRARRQELPIARVLTRCPSDDVAVHTGRHMTESAFAILDGIFSFRCARCQRVHNWRREDAWVEGQSVRAAVCTAV